MTAKTVHKLNYADFGALSSELLESNELRFSAEGKSMIPTIHSGDVLTIEKTDPESLLIGDIVLIQNASNSLLVHRIIKQDNQTWTTCGDALNTHDQPFKADQLIGRVKAIEREGNERTLSPAWGRVMAMISRNSESLVGRIVKKLVRSAGQ